jgi:hypothetical protein
MTSQQLIQQFVLIMLQQYKVDVRFKQGVLDDDFKNYGKGDVKIILKAIIKRFKTNTNPHNILPDWKLSDDLSGANKIRLLDEGIRVVYKVVEELPTHTVIDIYAVVLGGNQIVRRFTQP